LRFARDYTKCYFRPFWALLVAFLAANASGRNFSKCSILGPEDRLQLKQQTDPPFLGTEANSYSVSGLAIVKQYTVAASIPASASLQSLHERVKDNSDSGTKCQWSIQGSVHLHCQPLPTFPPNIHMATIHYTPLMGGTLSIVALGT
jgi:hypothetical protein